MDRIRALVQQTSRTFALGIGHLPAGLERPVSVAYLLLRVSDYFEDNRAMPLADKVAHLGAWSRALREAEDAGTPFEGPSDFDDALPDALAARSAGLVLDAYRALSPEDRAIVGGHVADSTDGMARWLARGPDFGTEADLDDYMFQVAGRVGVLLTDLFSRRVERVRREREAMTRLGIDFGLGLQTVNVIRGLSDDPARGWYFVPRSFLPAGVEPAAVWSEPTSPASEVLLDRLVGKAARHLEAAREYVLAIPRRHHGIRIFCLLPLLFALRTLELSRVNPAVYTREVKLDRGEVLSIARRTRLLAASNRWVASAARGLSEG